MTLNGFAALERAGDADALFALVGGDDVQVVGVLRHDFFLLFEIIFVVVACTLKKGQAILPCGQFRMRLSQRSIKSIS